MFEVGIQATNNFHRVTTHGYELIPDLQTCMANLEGVYSSDENNNPTDNAIDINSWLQNERTSDQSQNLLLWFKY